MVERNDEREGDRLERRWRRARHRLCDAAGVGCALCRYLLTAPVVIAIPAVSGLNRRKREIGH
jgi:hypothetical protein